MARLGLFGEHHPDYISPKVIRWRALTNGPLTILAIGSLPLLALEFVRDKLTEADRGFLDVVDVVVFVAFAVDYLVQFALTNRRSHFVRGEWMELLLVVSQGLAMVPALTALGVLRVLRATRALRAIAAFTRILTSVGLSSHRGREFLRQHSARLALSIAGLTWLTAGVAFTIAEDVSADADPQSFGDGLWWSISTITTVGYGDIVPTTFAGRVVGGITMVIGISVFAVVTASAAEFLMRRDGNDHSGANGAVGAQGVDGVQGAPAGANGDAGPHAAVGDRPSSGNLEP